MHGIIYWAAKSCLGSEGVGEVPYMGRLHLKGMSFLLVVYGRKARIGILVCKRVTFYESVPFLY